jgi:DNA mismatch endonuclease (patch repair protein)
MRTHIDPFDADKRSAIMRAVKSRDTSPELVVRRAAHALGFRFRLGGSGLPGRPDLVFAKRRKVIFVHGCFWHGHACKRGARLPTANASYWSAKIERNRSRDGASLTKLAELGWLALTIWECELAEREGLAKRLSRFLA